MNVRIILAVVVSIITFSMNAQDGFGSRIDGASFDINKFQNVQTTLRNSSEPENIDGSPFLFENLVLAKVYFRNTEQKPTSIYINYNIYADMMKMSEVKEEQVGSDIKILPRTSNLDIVIQDKTFRYMEFKNNGNMIRTYVEILKELENEAVLVLNRTMEIKQPPGGNRSSYGVTRNPKFDASREFFIIDDNGIAISVANHKRKVYKNMIDSKADMIKEYIKSNNIDFDDDYIGLQKVAVYYSSVK
ncbi:hypothetical protein [Nonlabens antarcticus]|uniref:hypothetical protein n=1 Tax=Nonlabens antarcticus TaxID=392714 RepID=UPI001891680E|nr:hypothetical protein [Nonlabens antarcticus]